jgi:phosphatidylserine decarboxylase
VLQCADRAGRPFLLVLVGASLVGGIHLAALPRADWVGAHCTSLGAAVHKGAEIGWFSFGSTVVAARPRGTPAQAVRPGAAVRVGQTLFPEPS